MGFLGLLRSPTGSPLATKVVQPFVLKRPICAPAQGFSDLSHACFLSVIFAVHARLTQHSAAS